MRTHGRAGPRHGAAGSDGLGMLELFGFTTGNTFRAAIALEEAGLQYQQRKVDLRLSEHQAGEYRLVNATGRIPTLIDSDGPDGKRLVLTQSNAILLYVAEKSGKLLPAVGVERARALEWLFFFVTDVIAPSHQAFYLRSGSAAGDLKQAAHQLDARALSMYEHIDRQLAGQPFLAGDSFTVADIAGYTITAAIASHLAGSLGNVARWFRTVGARPAVKRGMAAFD
jgi:GST-like protein